MNSVGKVLTLAAITSRLLAFTVFAQVNMDATQFLK